MHWKVYDLFITPNLRSNKRKKSNLSKIFVSSIYLTISTAIVQPFLCLKWTTEVNIVSSFTPLSL